MKRDGIRPSGAGALSGVLAAAIILTGVNWAADRVRSSEFYHRSRLISMIVAQDQVGIRDMAGNRRNVDMMLKFVGALTSAYIDFELIPVGETSTFAAVFESIPAETTVEKFEYHRKNLTITGNAATVEEYERFLTALREGGHFESVGGHYYLTTENDIRFELECIAKTAQAFLNFSS